MQRRRNHMTACTAPNPKPSTIVQLRPHILWPGALPLDPAGGIAPDPPDIFPPHTSYSPSGRLDKTWRLDHTCTLRTNWTKTYITEPKCNNNRTVWANVFMPQRYPPDGSTLQCALILPGRWCRTLFLLFLFISINSLHKALSAVSGVCCCALFQINACVVAVTTAGDMAGMILVFIRNELFYCMSSSRRCFKSCSTIPCLKKTVHFCFRQNFNQLDGKVAKIKMLCKCFPPNMTHVTALPCETQMFSIVTLCWNVLFATNYPTTELTHSKLKYGLFGRVISCHDRSA